MTSSNPSGGTPVSTDDYVGIARLLNRYSDAVIHRNGVQWASCWDEESVWDLGRGRLVTGKEAIVGLWYAAMGGMAAVIQQVHNGDAWYENGSRDRAVGRWSISERYLTSTGTRAVLLAEYHDGFVKRDREWLFTRRFLKPHYQGPADLSADFANTRDGLEASEETPDV